MDELTMFASLRPDSEVLPAAERAALRVSLFGSSAEDSGADPVLGAPPSIADDPELTLIELEPPRPPGPRRRSRRVAYGVLAIAVAAAVVTTLVVISRDHMTAPADTPIPVPSPLEEPSPDEVATASNVGDYEPGLGPTEVTTTRRYVSLRLGPQGWAYATGSADSPAVHYGMLGEVDDLVLSALDDRLFVASSPASLSPDPPRALRAWLIDSVTGQRGALRWVDQPTAMDSAEQVLVLPARLQLFGFGQRFPPRVVDRRDWTIRPLSVPDDATAAVEIHQPGSGRIWIGTAPDGGEVGLAYTDDGGSSWTDVELPGPLRPTSEELRPTIEGLLAEGEDAQLVVAATGDNIAVAARWETDGLDHRLFASADAGETWDVVPVEMPGNGRLLFVMDERLVFAVGIDAGFGDLFVSNSASDWSRLERVEDPPHSPYPATSSEFNAQFNKGFNVGQRGVASLYRTVTGEQPIFSTDLSDWWSIPSLRDVSSGPGE